MKRFLGLLLLPGFLFASDGVLIGNWPSVYNQAPAALGTNVQIQNYVITGSTGGHDRYSVVWEFGRLLSLGGSMLEKMFGIMPDWLKSQVIVRVIYTAASFATARIVAFLTGDYLATLVGHFVAASGHMGIQLQFKIVSVDQKTLEAAITAGLMLVGEFVIDHLHQKIVLPAISATTKTTGGK